MEIATFRLHTASVNNHNIFYDINLKYGRTALRLIRRHERCSSKLARLTNHLTFLTRCIRSRIVPKDLQVRTPVPTKGARRVAELASTYARQDQRTRPGHPIRPYPDLRRCRHNNRRTVRQRTAEGTTEHRNSEDRNAPITAVENQPITAQQRAL